MIKSKCWNWEENKEKKWLIPCREAAYFAQRWQEKGFKKFLDVGCGLGRHSVYMAEKDFDVTALDLSEYGVEHTKKWAAERNIYIKTVIADFAELPFEKECFDCVMAYNSIYHTDKDGFTKALSEIYRVLKRGGELYITLISKNTYSFITELETNKRIDKNTILRSEKGAEREVPHFYVDLNDIRELFVNWTFLDKPVEICEYDFDRLGHCSKHWVLYLKK